MDNKDKRLMTMLVLVTIFLGVIAIVYFDPAGKTEVEKENLYVESVRDDFSDFYEDSSVYNSGAES